MGLLAVGAADRRVVTGVASSAVRDRTWMVLGSVWLSTDGTGVVDSSTPLSGVPIELTFVAASGGAEGDVFSNLAFPVENSDAGSTQRLLGDLPNEGDDH